MNSVIAAHTRLGKMEVDRLSCGVKRGDGKEKRRERYTSILMLRVLVTKTK